VRRATLVVNLPGSPAGARNSLAAIAGILPHAVDVVQGRTGEGGTRPPVAPEDGHA
jgi:molybdopterin biosynthesis enzyme MoaB